MKIGTVYLVGSGPGDPGLITMKGYKLLQNADVVVHDRLAPSELLDVAKKAEFVYMGKEPDTPGAFQELINEQLVKAALQGKNVVRLKGGDPFVFGRGGEEAIALKNAGVPFEIIPGITSAIAVPAYSGIPVTHRRVSTAFTVVTGSEDPSKPTSSLDWKALSKTPGTLVILMGWKSLPSIIDALIKEGKSPKTPISVTQWGTISEQKTVDGTFSDIVSKGIAANISSPVVSIIGDVVELRGDIRWFDQGPLFGKKILVTRTRTQASRLSDLIRSEGGNPVELPTIEIQPLENYKLIDAAINSLSNYSWVVFTSANGVDAVFNRMKFLELDSRVFSQNKVGAIGPATAEEIEKYGIRPDLIPDVYTTEAMSEAFKPYSIGGVNFLLFRADIASETLPLGLRKLGANVTELDAYNTKTPENSSGSAREILSSGTIDAITFTSSSTVKNLVELLNGDISGINASKVVSIGPVTSQTAVSLGVTVDIEAKEHTISGLHSALLELMGYESNSK
ncbi:MAG TPA: uroporphyrinogen-III C-methyltransferase [Dehalococcoidia bacterium]|nr:uroporphyrinogen-III C-methyltransferase [Dehalococcoidia bacterium]